jgi:hypothetical protein
MYSRTRKCPYVDDDEHCVSEEAGKSHYGRAPKKKIKKDVSLKPLGSLLSDFAKQEYIPSAEEDLKAILLAKHYRLRLRGLLPLKGFVLSESEKDNVYRVSKFLEILAQSWSNLPLNIRFQLLCYFNGHCLGLDIKKTNTISVVYIDSVRNPIFSQRIHSLMNHRFGYQAINKKTIMTATQKDLKYCTVFALNDLVQLSQNLSVHEQESRRDDGLDLLQANPTFGAKVVRYSQFSEDARFGEFGSIPISANKGTLQSYLQHYNGQYQVGKIECQNRAIIASCDRLKQKAHAFWLQKGEQEYLWWMMNLNNFNLLYNPSGPSSLPDFYRQIYL